MKSKTSCFDMTVIRKDITRFAPLWAIYLIGGVLVLLGLYSGDSSSAIAKGLGHAVGEMAAINMVYAILCAQLLFGDMFKSRLCNALHAMPIRRETWFMSHLTSGLLFSVGPHLAVAPVLMAICGKLWFVPLIWVLGMTMCFVFFFGVAVFSMFCTGNRFAAVLVYCGINFASLILRWVVYILYEPLLPGIVLPEEPNYMFSPVIWLTSLGSKNTPEGFLYFTRRVQEAPIYRADYIYREFGTAWEYLSIVFVIGLVFMGIALLMYRKRALETAGDFIAVKPLRPVFSVVFTIASGCIFSLFGSAFMDSGIYFMVAGLAVGYFVSQMMLQRTVRVFNGKAFLKLGILSAVLVGSIVVTALDPMGMVRYVPNANAVASVEISRGGEIREYDDLYMMVTDLQDIEQVTQAHRQLIQEDSPNGYSFCIRYKMKNGTTVYRRYNLSHEGMANDLLAELYCTPEVMLGYEDWETYKNSVVYIMIDGNKLQHYMDYADLHGALEAIRADIEAGNILPDTFRNRDNVGYLAWVEIDTGSTVRQISIYTDSEAFLKWASQYPALDEYLSGQQK